MMLFEIVALGFLAFFCVGMLVMMLLEEVQAYCAERHNKVDPAKFYDYYEANGWVQGKAGKPVKDWRACVRTWERNNFDTGKKVQAVPDYMIADYESPKPSASLDETKEIKEMLEVLKNA